MAPSTAPALAASPRWAFASRQPRLQPRLALNWAESEVRALAAVVDAAGHFNGSCRGDPTVEAVPAGACVAAFVDVTTYCCGAVGGLLKGIPDASSPSSSSAASGSSSASATALPADGDIDGDGQGEILCHTSAYRTMLMCYDDLVHNACALNLSPSGICKSNGADTSALRSSARPSPATARVLGRAGRRRNRQHGAPGAVTTTTLTGTLASLSASQLLVGSVLGTSLLLSALGTTAL